MTITVNGETQEVAQGVTISELIDELGIKVTVMAAAINMEIIKKEQWATHKVVEGDKLELLHFVGGG